MSETENLTPEELEEAEKGLMTEISKRRGLIRNAALKNISLNIEPQLLFDDGSNLTFEMVDVGDVQSDDDTDIDYSPSIKKSKGAKLISSKKPKKKDSEFDVKVALCSTIRAFPQVYQITHKEYSNKQIKDGCWIEISQKVSTMVGEEISVAACRKYWDALRESTR